MSKKWYFMFLCFFIVSFCVFATESTNVIIKKKVQNKQKTVTAKKKTATIKGNIKKVKVKAKMVKKTYRNTSNPAKVNYISEVLADENGKVISGENEEVIHPIASLTKLMTALITIEEIEKGKISINDMVYVSKEVLKLGGSVSGIRYDESVTLEDLLKSAIIKSDNGSAYLIGKYVGGSEEKFIHRMNERALELGMKNTKFYSSSGLPPYYYTKAGIIAEGRDYDISTAADIAKLSAEVVKHPMYLEISSQYYTTIKKGRVTLRNHNHLISKYDCIDGLKTGFHNIGHYNVAISSKKDGVRLITVVFGAPTLTARENEVVRLLDIGYQNLGFAGLTKQTALDYNKTRQE